MKEKSLVILAAGIGSRFKDGVKQLKTVGPAGECIMDYSIHDAMEAGFNRIVFIIRKDIEALFEELIGQRIRRICEKRGVEVACAYQEKENLPGGFVCPEGRVKPWGTGHALLSCKGLLNGSFVVINADDYYGKDAYLLMSRYLDELEDNSRDKYAVAGFQLANTLSEHGGVTRGLCVVNGKGLLTGIQETKNILKTAEGILVEREGKRCYLDGNTSVSMNMWAFAPDVLERLEKQFVAFLADGGLEAPKSEFLIPTEVGAMLRDGVQVSVIPTPDHWFGMTFAEEVDKVQKAFTRMTQEGIYPTPLFADK